MTQHKTLQDYDPIEPPVSARPKGMATYAGDDPPIKIELARLEEVVHKLHHMEELLRMKLEPVLTPSEPSDSDARVDLALSDCSNTTGQLRERVHDIDSAIYQIQSLLDRLEV